MMNNKMTELEKKAEEYAKNCENKKEIYCLLNLDFNSCLHCGYFKHYMKGYEQGQKDMPLSGQLVHEVDKLKKENEELKENKDLLMTRNLDLVNQIEKMKCCGNCGNERCTSKYRGNSCYHRQNDGYACADNEDWTPRKDK